MSSSPTPDLTPAGEVRLSRRRFLGLAALGATGLLGGGMVAGSYPFKVSRHHFVMPRLDRPLRIAHLTDLHFGIYIREGSISRWVDAAMAEMPDLIVITGDFVDTGILGGVAPLVRELARLQAPLGVWGVWGNHDYDNWFGSVRDLGPELTKSGLRILQNEGVSLRDDLFLAGVDDFRYGQPDLRAALAQRPTGAACLLLSHNPDLLPTVPPSVELTLCGHTHGGQIKLPGIGAVVTASKYGTRFAEGWIEQPTTAFVSRGLGVTVLPVRLNCQAELVLLELEPA